MKNYGTEILELIQNIDTQRSAKYHRDDTLNFFVSSRSRHNFFLLLEEKIFFFSFQMSTMVVSCNIYIFEDNIGRDKRSGREGCYVKIYDILILVLAFDFELV